MATVDIIIPTWNNPQFLNPCVRSIAATGVLDGLAKLIIVNNGQQPVKQLVGQLPNVEVLEPGMNLGWERGLDLGLQRSDARFVCFQNDDTLIPPASGLIYHNLLTMFGDRDVAAVGPSTTVAAGWHSVFMDQPLRHPTEVSYLIFFMAMLRREHLDLVGGIDASAPGGDDFDMSIRLRKAGKKLIVCPTAFVIHHGFKSGTRLRGDQNIKGGWNSQEMSDETNRWLIQKHGFTTFFETKVGLMPLPLAEAVDKEGDVIRKLVDGERVVEMGCGQRKTVSHAVGVDRVSHGEHIPHIGDGCVSDVVGDVQKPLPFEPRSQDVVIARHILEHCLDTVQTLKNWNVILRMGGELIVAVPNEDVVHGVPMNPEHVHAFTAESLRTLMQVCGFEEVSVTDPANGISFVGRYRKVLHMIPSPQLELASV